MTIHKLMIKDVRNLASATFSPSPDINILYGLNGSGKTSILESIHLLGLARSFRSARLKPVIRHKKGKCTVFAQIQSNNDRLIPVGVSRDIEEENFQIRVAGETLKSTSELARLLPLQIINPDTFKLLEGSPKQRRQFLDWGVFHVKHHEFLPLWKRTQKVLKQRNSLLRHGKITGSSCSSQLSVWDVELVKAAEAVDQLRQQYFDRLTPVFQDVLSQLTSLADIKVGYYRGWDRERPLAEVLKENTVRDFQTGYTQSGPQRADIRVRLEGSNAVDILSRGQLKLVVCALKLAQGYLFSKMTGSQCVFLVDDLPSELDVPHRKAMCRILQNMQSQVFITCAEPGALVDCWEPEINLKVFHVKQGSVNLESGREIRQTESLEKEYE
ncbi:DNA replication/repair protein RecF [Endozoicomonas sp. 8E]|uniref:DNA replication/repair protein RecF n=1 Tax=Endozoicomonas sp. 8E TaxID=3035692 RepID=UPI002938F424|nr:DNA replication/repair protein RecF [Endozoicomonas sp. 8E]WOG28074.1 DNA replication/repair protein RecF [Endozoicomonas sp. 8E]